jgi:hypothetical protein
MKVLYGEVHETFAHLVGEACQVQSSLTTKAGQYLVQFSWFDIGKVFALRLLQNRVGREKG